MKKLICALLAFVMLLSIIPMAAAADDFVDGLFGIRIGDTEIRESNHKNVFGDGTVSYDRGILTLNNARIAYNEDCVPYGGLLTQRSLEIRVNGTCEITGDFESGIITYGNNLKFTGSGTLKIHGREAGIHAFGSEIVINGPTVTVSCDRGTAFVCPVNIRMAAGYAIEPQGAKIEQALEPMPVSGDDQPLIDTVNVLQNGKICSYVSFAPNGRLPVSGFPFTDVPQGSWYYGDALYAYKNGIIAGTSATTFSPKVNMTKEMMAAILWRHAGCPMTTVDGSLKDVRNGKWYTECCYWAVENGITYATKENFGIGYEVTRADLAAMFYNYAEYLGLNTSGSVPESDAADLYLVDQSSRTCLKWAMATGLLVGKGEGRLDPFGKTSRAEFAAVYHRFAENPLFDYNRIYIRKAPDDVEYDRATGLNTEGLVVVAEKKDGTTVKVDGWRVYVTDTVNPVHAVNVCWNGFRTWFYAAATSNTGKYDIEALQKEMNGYLKSLGFLDGKELDLNNSSWRCGDSWSGSYIDKNGGLSFLKQKCRDFVDYEVTQLEKDGARSDCRAFCYICYDKSIDTYEIHVLYG